MRKVAFISALSAVIGYAAVHFAFFANPKPAAAPEVAPAEAPAAGMVLADVVEVTDTDALLDARPKESHGAPFDSQVVPASFATPAAAAVPPIPPAAD